MNTKTRISDNDFKKYASVKDQAPGRLTTNEINAGLHSLETVLEQAPQLLENMPDDVLPEPDATKIEDFPITIELVQKAVAWDKRYRVLANNYHEMLKDIATGKKTLNMVTMPTVRSKVIVLLKRGFKPTD